MLRGSSSSSSLEIILGVLIGDSCDQGDNPCFIIEGQVHVVRIAVVGSVAGRWSW